MTAAPLTAVSLFAGIGGFDLALTRVGIKVAAAVEIDPECRAVLARRFPQTSLFPDVSEVTVDQLLTAGFVPRGGVLTAGWPCQGNSVAGNRRGLDDPRSGLWRHVVRLLAEARPRWFLGENVPGLLGVNRGRDFAQVIGDLDDLGYGVAWRVLDAQWFGVPQRRRRVFLAGCLGNGTAPVQVLHEPERGGWHPPQNRQTRPGTPAPARQGTGGTSGQAGRVTASTLQGGGRRGHRIDAEGAAGGHLVPVTLAHTVTAREAKGTDSEATSGVIVDQAAAVRRLTPLECERLQGFPDDWTSGQSDAARYRQLGNSLAVPVAAWITARLAAAEAVSPASGPYERKRRAA